MVKSFSTSCVRKLLFSFTFVWMIRISNLLIIVFLLISFSGCWSGRTAGSSDHVLYVLVRHAEKVDESVDPPLSDIGLERAHRLDSMLSSIPLSAIYSTAFQRTQQTVQALSQRNNLAVQPYDPRHLDAFGDTLKAKHKNGVVLISGHSNTTAELANKLMGRAHFESISSDDYGRMLMVFCLSKKPCYPLEIHY